jgi:polysaccharide export outer membrane protein
MDRIYLLQPASPTFLSVGFALATSFAPLGAFAQVNPSPITPSVTQGFPVAQPVTPQTYAVPPYAGSSAASMLNSMDVLNDQTKLKAGDMVSYRVLEEQEQPTELTISDDGQLPVPILGRFPAAGKTCKQLALQLKPMLEKEYFYKATVIIGIDTLSTKPIGKVYLTGQVKEQGAIDIPPNETLTVSRAILMDGGLADFADRRRVRLLHHSADTGKTTTTIVDLKEILDRGHSEKDPVVQDGDTIDVPQRLINF